MSAIRYQVQITAANVPKALAGAPLSVEIISRAGYVWRVLLPLSRTPVTQDVGRPGSYLIRATLPCGRLITNIVTTPDTPNPQGDALAKAVLDLKEYDARTPRPAREVIGNVLWKWGFKGVKAPSYEWGTFLRWDSAPTKQRRRFEIPKMVLRRGGVITAGPYGELLPPWRPGHLIEPHFISTSKASADAGSLVVWSPGPKRRPARIAPDPDAASHRGRSPLLASLESVDPITWILFTYVRRGELDAARTTVPDLLKMVETDAAFGPNQGLLAAYVLYKLRDPHVQGLISRLRTQYPALPDIQVLAAAQLITEGKIDEAIEPLTAALVHGAPVYTEGVRLLRDGTSFFRDLQPHEERFQHNARYAACIAAAANFQSELTCLRMGHDLVMEFVES